MIVLITTKITSIDAVELEGKKMIIFAHFLLIFYSRITIFSLFSELAIKDSRTRLLPKNKNDFLAISYALSSSPVYRYRRKWTQCGFDIEPNKLLWVSPSPLPLPRLGYNSNHLIYAFRKAKKFTLAADLAAKGSNSMKPKRRWQTKRKKYKKPYSVSKRLRESRTFVRNDLQFAYFFFTGLQDSDDEDIEGDIDQQIESMLAPKRIVKEIKAPIDGSGVAGLSSAQSTNGAPMNTERLELAKKLASRINMAKNLGPDAKGATQQAAEAIMKGGGSQPLITVSQINSRFCRRAFLMIFQFAGEDRCGTTSR